MFEESSLFNNNDKEIKRYKTEREELINKLNYNKNDFNDSDSIMKIVEKFIDSVFGRVEQYFEKCGLKGTHLDDGLDLLTKYKTLDLPQSQLVELNRQIEKKLGRRNSVCTNCALLTKKLNEAEKALQVYRQGRKYIIPDSDFESVKNLKLQKVSDAKIAKIYDCSVRTVERYRKKHGITVLDNR